MFDLVDLLSKKQQTESIEQQKITSVLFYQTAECQELVQEAFRFEGIVPPAMARNQDDQIADHIRQSDIEIVIVELNNSKDVSTDAERISHLLPNHASVIVVGSEDAISTIRNLKAMGFYYVFWPVSKQEFIDFVRSVYDNRQRSSHRGPGKKRRAKYISILGSKGGVGTSFITAEVAYQLSSARKTSCLVVEQNYHGGNLDILMGIRKLEKRKIQKGSLASSLDSASAQSLLHKQNPMLSMLALASEQLDTLSLLDYSNAVVDQLSEEVNFILEDLSSSVGFSLEADKFLAHADMVVLVIDPTVSSVREAARLKERVHKLNSNPALRLITVLNHTVANKLATAGKQEAETILKQPIDIEIPYCDAINATILEDKRVVASKLKAAEPLKQLTSLLLGETLVQAKGSFLQHIQQWLKKS
ncbi:chromosome partitioning protein ParA [Vibrio cincinnatiensis]|uniref:AAA family ATPase n=1 Tax=Vibrio cincinnatiensis TaxID=675 RepID=UPI001EDDA990|nr:chromosome partitioning protein ParA [Vibrio cincinnatiensis]MCG3765505.1 chromosome partitioning protein ParA [Vibrio cincinnatiensis]